MKEQLTLSYSRARSFDECPAKYKAEYIDRLRGSAEPHLLVGKIVHECCDRYVKHLQASKLGSDFDAMADIFEKVWGGPVREDLPESFREEVWALCVTAREHLVFEDIGVVTAPELSLAVDENWQPVEWNDPKAAYRGRIDRLDVDAEGNALVVDYKTGYRLEQISETHQTPLYAVFVRAHFPGIKSIDVMLAYLRQQIYRRGPMDDDGIERAKAWISGVAHRMTKAIATGSWPARPGAACRGCSAFAVCPARQTTVRPVPPEDEAAAVLLVERIVLLDRERKDLMDAIAPWLVQYGSVEANGMSLGYHTERGLIFDVRKVWDILKSRGFDPMAYMSIDRSELKKIARKDIAMKKEIEEKASTDASKSKLKLTRTGDEE